MRHRIYHPPESRRLKLHFLHHPKSYSEAQGEWDLERGFRLRVLSRNALALFVGKPNEQSTLLSQAPLPGEDSFLLIPAPLGPQAEHLEVGLRRARDEGWEPEVTLILSDDRLMEGSSRQLKSQLKAKIPKQHKGLVLWVWQEMPGELCRDMDFFNCEQILHQLGRMGRRVASRAGWRRYLP